jgi:transposase-like protein
MPTFIALRCPHCHRDQIVKRGKTARGTQRYLCQNTLCIKGSFLLDYRNRGYLPEVKELTIDMSLNACGVRDTARLLHISTDTVLSELKKKEPVLESVNTELLRTLNPEEVTVDIERAGEAEMDEMWSYVGHKGNPRCCGMPLITARERSWPMSSVVGQMRCSSNLKRCWSPLA